MPFALTRFQNDFGAQGDLLGAYSVVEPSVLIQSCSVSLKMMGVAASLAMAESPRCPTASLNGRAISASVY
jgi:hypothetical protein